MSTNIPHPSHGRKLGLCGVSLTTAKLPRDDHKAAGQVRDEVESLLIQSSYLENAPFTWITIAIRYGLINEQEPHYQKVNRKYGDLPLAIEVDVRDMVGASFETLRNVYHRAVLICLIHAGHKFGLPTAVLEGALQAE